MEEQLDNLKNWYRGLPDKKRYVEFISALLSVPVMTTVILLNLNSLTQKNTAKPATETPTPAITKIVETLQPVNVVEPSPKENQPTNSSSSAAPTPSPVQCKKQVGPITIVSPHENEVIAGNSVCVTMNYQQDGYCDVTWSYSLDNASWSGYSQNDICLYNLSPGNHVLQVRVKSTASDDQILLQRTFTTGGTATPTPSPTTAPTPTPAPTESTSSQAGSP